MVGEARLATNPFAVTKANDFTDEEIRDFWVDYEHEGGFLSLFAPREAMPKLLLGGKGSGKTHLMRYYSFPLQVLRSRGDLIDQVQSDGYVGIYTRCGGLDSSRFAGKGQDAETWATVFAHYTDLWLSYQLIEVVERLVSALPRGQEEAEQSVVASVYALFDRLDCPSVNSFTGLRQLLRNLQRNVDLAVNNAAISRRMDVTIAITPGRLTFGAARAVSTFVAALSTLSFIYLIDELELLTEDQQRFINTLVRDRSPPVTFRLGARTYGIRTFATLAAQEENRAGSEFDLIALDDHLRREKKSYDSFARKLVASRLKRAGILVPSEGSLDELFESIPQSRFRRDETSFVQARAGERRYFRRLIQQLSDGIQQGILRGVTEESVVTEVVDFLRVSDTPLLEKLNILFLYRAISRRKNLRESAAEISEACMSVLEETAEQNKKYQTELQHFAFDLYAQICREYDQPLRYCGLPEFIQLSDGLPRSLLIILKSIYKWAEFSGEQPFRSGRISVRAQERGVLEASDWFLREAPRGGGEEAVNAAAAVARLAELLRELLYSDKPPECSLTTFSTDLTSAPRLAKSCVETAQQFSLLVRVPRGQKDKNTGRVDDKFQLNRMLAPRWQLPAARRGAISLNGSEMGAIFCPKDDAEFQRMKGRRRARAMFPFGLAGSKSNSMPLFDDPEDD